MDAAPDEVWLVVDALAAGAGPEVRARPEVKAAHRQLRALVVRRFRGTHRAVAVLADHEEDPETYRLPMAKMVRVHGVADDPAVQAAARAVLAVLEPSRQSG
jgi:hypothetical protein